MELTDVIYHMEYMEMLKNQWIHWNICTQNRKGVGYYFEG